MSLWGCKKTGGNALFVRNELEALFHVGSDADMVDGEEDEEASSSRRDGPSVGSRRPRENDPSLKRSRSGSDRPHADAGPFSSPRSEGDSISSGTVVSRTGPARDPWMPTPSEIHSRFGSTAPPIHELPPVRLAVGVETAGRRLGSGPPDSVDRLEAVERLQTAEFAALRQELVLLKAQLAQVSQTASNVPVDLGSKLVVVRTLFGALEQASAPSHQDEVTRVVRMASVTQHKMLGGGACWTYVQRLRFALLRQHGESPDEARSKQACFEVRYGMFS
ncbi:unnamed protein product [Phytophthora fragariaefolia]|uniref:Unnamed protein product n=1 Tax=Phytophthora fragariaefolia TaxID=1490495 RepID=A0A9W6Y8J9_9STRA|nr:unnamed protein product [Phytophthora fragariaefolia]